MSDSTPAGRERSGSREAPLRRIDAQWRTAKYLFVGRSSRGQMALLREPMFLAQDQARDRAVRGVGG